MCGGLWWWVFFVFGHVCGLLNCICDTVGGVWAVDVKF